MSSAPLRTQKQSRETGAVLDGEDGPRTVVHEHGDILSRLKTLQWASLQAGGPSPEVYPPMEIAFGANTPAHTDLNPPEQAAPSWAQGLTGPEQLLAQDCKTLPG